MHHGSLYGLSKEVTKERADKLFDFFNLSDRKDDIITQYSFGMQKKALIIRGLITEPKILFLDEPTLGLDPKSKEELIDELIRLNKTGITIVLTTQSLQIATKSDKVIFVNHGAVRELTGKELYDNAGNEVLYINTTSLQPHEIDNINQLLSELDFIMFSEVRSHTIEIKMKNSADYIIKAIETIIKSGIAIYGIEFGSISLAQLYN
jgi:ABC-type multidrug transport system ATPase subunit